jgi:guanine deaminase
MSARAPQGPAPDAPSPEDKRHFLALAIAEATRGCQAGSGGPFGAVVVKDGVVIAQAHNAVVANNDPTAHAEVQAIRAACAALSSFQLDGCDLYASCEPCPMCLGAILWARPRAVYFAATRDDAARAGFDDAVFYRWLDSDGADSPVRRERVACEGAGEPFAAYATIPGKVRY